MVEDVLAAATVRTARLDRIGATLLAWDEITRAGVGRLGRGTDLARGLEQVRGRWDLREPMLWNYFTQHGRLGVEARCEVVATLFDEGLLRGRLEAGIEGGALLRW